MSRNTQFGPTDLKRCMVQKSNMDFLWEIICMVIRYNNSFQINLPSPEPELLKYARPVEIACMEAGFYMELQ